MPLFVCDKCHAVENTACGHYWHARDLEDGKPQQGKKARDEFFALKKEKRPAKKLTPLQRRMQSGHA